MRATLSGREFLSIVILFKKLLYIKEYEKSYGEIEKEDIEHLFKSLI